MKVIKRRRLPEIPTNQVSESILSLRITIPSNPKDHSRIIKLINSTKDRISSTSKDKISSTSTTKETSVDLRAAVNYIHTPSNKRHDWERLQVLQDVARANRRKRRRKYNDTD